MKTNNQKDFLVKETPITNEDFTFIDPKTMVHEQKFSTRPTTFFKDSMKRFAKNKSSVVAGVILGIMLLFSFTIPMFSQYDIEESHPEICYLDPKLFESGTGFWDGTKKWENIAVYRGDDNEGLNKEENWWPDPDTFTKSAVSNKSFSDLTYTSTPSKYANGGFVQVGYYYNIEDSKEYISFKPNYLTPDTLVNSDGSFDISINPVDNDYYLTSFEMYDEAAALNFESKETPENYKLGQAGLFATWYVKEDNGTGGLKSVKKEAEILPYSTAFNITNDSKINMSTKIKASEDFDATKPVLKDFSFEIRVKNLKNHQNTCVLIKTLKFETTEVNANTLFSAYSFQNGNELMLQEDKTTVIKNGSSSTYNNYSYWICTGSLNLFGAKNYYCSFTYDSYEAKLGIKTFTNFPKATLQLYETQKLIRMNFKLTQINWDDPNDSHYIDNFRCQILNKDKCPLVSFTKDNIKRIGTTNNCQVNVDVYQYKYYGYDEMPKFLFGTDKTGRDMLKYVSEGLRTSLLLGILTFAVCFTFGLIWGSICGYFGGTVDLVMERLTDILSGVPWIVVMTLVILKIGSNFWSFALALCLTGWIGTAATTRTQFYRFRGREYVLASRTLGANDARLIAKHILPNAMGTIITGAVLMIPSVIFSEATISYLGLGLQNIPSLGVILSRNQAELTTNSYLLIFPSIVIALLMISFNLFGNGLRDAINPSLKGEEA